MKILENETDNQLKLHLAAKANLYVLNMSKISPAEIYLLIGTMVLIKNTPGIKVGTGGHYRTLAVKSRNPPKISIRKKA